MKKVSFYSVLACVFILSMASCSSDDNNSTSPQDPQQVIDIVTQGTWRVTSYIDSGTDETNHFTGYNFTFDSGDILTATNGTNTYTGMWTITLDDDQSGDLDFNIAFASPENFADLTDDWSILEKTDTRIKLIDVSGGSGGTDYLTFEKN